MNRTPRLSKSGIEYLTHCWNFYSGCENWANGVCPVENCWARSITERFPGHYPNGFDPTIYPEAFLSPLHLRKPSIIGCAFMGDLFGDWVDPMRLVRVDPEGRIKEPLKVAIYRTIRLSPQHRFLFLTKCPQNLPRWSPFPDNCWVGVSATDRDSYNKAMWHLLAIQAKVKYISFEPLLDDVVAGILDNRHDWPVMNGSILQNTIQWVIIGSQTKPYKPPKMKWIDDIVAACDRA
ncbi:unnamed protein product, partial [marine sediment metagenome]